MEMIDIKNKPCQICGNKAYKGLHFQVDCCRACAAFYRRTILANRVHKCKNGRKACKIQSKNKSVSQCRYCRFAKCKSLGMRPKWENSNISAVNLNKNSTDYVCHKMFNRFQKSVGYESEQFKEILYGPLRSNESIDSKSMLQKLESCYINFHEANTPNGPTELKNFCNAEVISKYYNRIRMETAKMLMYCKEFADLSLHDKIILHKNVLNLFLYIEFIHSSIELGFHENNKYFMCVHDNNVVDLADPTDIIRVQTDDGKIVEKISTLSVEYRRKIIQLLYKPMVELMLTRFEIVYVLAQVLWSTQAIKEISDVANNLASTMTEVIANELHEYYVNKRRMNNYCFRLVKMLNLIEGSRLLHKELQNLTLLYEATNIFDFNADLSDFYF